MRTREWLKVDGRKLKRLRQHKLWLVQDLAERSGVHRNTISKLENNRGGAHPDTIRDLADTLGIEPAELIGEDE